MFIHGTIIIDSFRLLVTVTGYTPHDRVWHVLQRVAMIHPCVACLVLHGEALCYMEK